MKILNTTFITLVLLISFTSQANAQGCSDAGFCTIDSFKPGETDDVLTRKNQIKFGASYGGADHDIAVFGSYLEYKNQLSDKFGLSAKLTSLGQSQSSTDVSSFALSDIYLNATYGLSKDAKLTIGAKIPLSNGNIVQDDLSLPMDFQASLGTFDLILGLGYEVKNIQFVAAIQQPLTQNNNEFLSESYPTNSEFSSYQSTYKFKRSGDVLLRVSYPLNIGENFKITPSILPIYHLSNDKYTSAGVEKEILGSQGLTFNSNVYFDYAIDSRNSLQLNAAAPLVVRDARPDGLTRSFVVNLEYSIRF